MMLSLSRPGLAGSLPAYPDRSERNPKKKTPLWIAQFAYAFVSEVQRDAGFAHWWHAADKNKERLLYMFGKQDAAKYDRFVDAPSRENDPTGISQRIDRRILPLVPKHVRILSDKLEEQEFAPTVTVVDEEGEQEKADHLDTIRLWQQQGEFLQSQGIRPPDNLPAELPQDEDDLQLYAAAEYRHDEAVVMEQKLALCLAEANWKQLDRDVVLHFFAFGEACGYAGTGPGGKPRPSLLLPARCLFLSSASEDYRDMRAGAHLEYLTLGQLRAEAGDQLKEPDYQRIEETALTRPASDWTLPQGLGTATDSGVVEVVRCSFLSEDDLVYKTRTDKLGNRQTRRKSTDYKNSTGDGTVTRATATNVYEATLIVGTEFYYNCRLAVKQLRDMDNPLLGQLPYQPLTPGMLVGENSCPMDEVMGIEDFCQEQWLRLQEACLRAVPQGYNFDPEVLLESIALLKGKGIGDDGKLDLKPTLDMFYRTGNSVSKRKARDGSLLPPAITKNDTGVPTDVVQYWQNLRSGIQMLESIMGSNAVVSAATPSPELGKGVGELAVQGTLSSLGALAHGKQAIFDGVCRAMGLRIWLQEPRQPVTGTLAGAPGKPALRVAPRPQLSNRRFAFRIERLPTKQDWADFYAVAQRSLDTKEITLADYTYLVEVDNLKLARRMLAQRAKRNLAEKMKADAANQQATFQGQAQAAEAAEESKRKTQREMHQMAMEREKEITSRTLQVAYIYADGQHKTEESRGDVNLQKTQMQQTAETYRHALREDSKQAAAAQQAVGAGYADLVPAGPERPAA